MRFLSRPLAAASVLLIAATAEARLQSLLQFRALQPIEFPFSNEAGKQAFALGHLNEDTTLDLVVLDHEEERLAVLLGRGDGTFDPPVSYELDGTPTAVAVADLASPFASDAQGDVDGWADVIITYDDGEATIFLGRGDGGLDPPEQDLVDVLDANEIVGVVVDDLDGNGRLDLAFLDLFDEVYFLCNEAGNFAPCITDVIDTSGQGALAMGGGDFDHDTFRDLAVLNLDSKDLSLIFGNGDGSFGEVGERLSASPAGDQEPSHLAVGRLDGDATDDLVIGNHGDAVDLTVLALYGDSSRNFTHAGFSGALDLAAFALADLDADGALDSAAIQTDEAGLLSVSLGDRQGGFGLPFVAAGFPVGAGRAVSIADLDGDTKLDVLVLDAEGTALRIGLNDTAPLCSGDCDQSGTVSIDELVRGVSIALSNGSGGACEALDTDGSNRVEINELVAAVARALRGCAA